MKLQAGFVLFTFSLIFVSSCSKTRESNTIDAQSKPPLMSAAEEPPPALTGKMVFHRYQNYGDAAQLFIYDFSANTLTEISKNWGLHNPINGHFSPDGSKLVFMAEAVLNGEWDIYLCDVGSANAPVNLTAANGLRDEDPKFSPDGNSICFKQTIAGTGQLKIMNLNGTITHHVTNSKVECSMPYFTTNGQSLVYARGAGTTSDIYIVNINGSGNLPIASERNLQEYYPVVFNSNSYLYTRHLKKGDYHDQVYMGNFANTTKTSLSFNTAVADYSDAYPYNTEYLLLSSTKAGGYGGYDLYIASITSGKIWSLSLYNSEINNGANELGTAFSAPAN